MALQPPAPRCAGPRRAEHGDRVVVGIAQQTPECLELTEYALQPEDVEGLAVADAAEAGLHQLVPGGACRRWHRLEGHALAAARDVVPVEALLVLEREHRAAARIGGQRGEKRRRRTGDGPA